MLQAVGMPRHDVLFPVQSHADRTAVLQYAPDVKRRAALDGPVHDTLRQKMVGKKTHVPREKAVRLQGIKKFPYFPAPLLDEEQAVFHGQRVQQGGTYAGVALKFRIVRIDSRGVGRPGAAIPLRWCRSSGPGGRISTRSCSAGRPPWSESWGSPPVFRE